MIDMSGASTRHLVGISVLLVLGHFGQTEANCSLNLKKKFNLTEYEAKISLESYEAFYHLHLSAEENCLDIPKHVINVSDVKDTLRSLFWWNAWYSYHLVKVRHYQQDLSDSADLDLKLLHLHQNMIHISSLMSKHLAVTFTLPPQPDVIKNGDHAKKIYGWCVLYRIENLLEEGNRIVQSLNLAHLCKKKKLAKRFETADNLLLVSAHGT